MLMEMHMLGVQLMMEFDMEGQKVRIGGRALKLNADEVELAAEGDWRLVECTAYSKDGWKSLKLYLDRPEIKNVWRLGLHGSHYAKTKDGFLLQRFYPSMWNWVIACANGKRVPLPPDQAAPKATVVPSRINNFVIEKIEERGAEKAPLSHKPQTAKLGRYVVGMVAEEFSISELEAKIYVNAMIAQGLIEFVMTDRHKRISGLRLGKEFSNG